MEHGQLRKFKEQTLFKLLMSFSSWMTGPNWPINGEIDIIEDVNSATVNGMTLHTDAGCSVSMLQSGPALRSLSTPSPEMPFQQTSPAAIPIQVVGAYLRGCFQATATLTHT